MVNKNDLYALPADLQDKADAFKERYKALKAIDSRYAKMDLIEFFQSEDGKAIRQTKKDLRAQMYEDKAFLRRYLKSEKFIAEHTARARELMQVFTEKDLF